jgi:clan AA aspartic protease
MRVAQNKRIQEKTAVGIVEAYIELSNRSKPELRPLKVRAMVDTGAMTICIPQHVALQLPLPQIEKREVTTAEQQRHIDPCVGPIPIRFENRTCFSGALVIGESVLLGVVPMEDMDLVVLPAAGTITVNPRSPNIPAALAK